MGELDGKVALVAGASRGIGKGAAVELGRAGAHVVVTGRTLRAGDGSPWGSLSDTVAEIDAGGGTAEAIRCDFTDDQSVADCFAQVATTHDHLDVLVTSMFNADEFGETIGQRFWELPVEIWHDVVDVGTRSAYMAAVGSAPLLLKAGRGLIVHVSGRAAERYRYNVAYGVGKAALDKMTRDMAEELRDHQVAVVSLWPNVTRTENINAAVADGSEFHQAFGDLNLLETPRYTGRAVVALAADPAVMARTGRRFWVAELGAEYGFTDENGRAHPLPE